MVVFILRYLGTMQKLDYMDNPAATTFEVTFVEDSRLVKLKFAELTKFRSEYHGSVHPQKSLTWKLTYNFDLSVKIQLKFHYLSRGGLNDGCEQERLNEALIYEFEEVYKNFFGS